jgi:hypothetical protein
MPVIRTRDEDDYVSSENDRKNTSVTNKESSRPRRKAATTKRAVVLLPFPYGEPTEAIHKAVIIFSSIAVPTLDLGTIDNLLLFLFFSTKRTGDKIWSLELSTLPARHSFMDMLHRRPSVPLQNLKRELADKPYEEWEVYSKEAVEKTIIITKDYKFPCSEDFEKTLRSDIFIQ